MIVRRSLPFAAAVIVGLLTLLGLLFLADLSNVLLAWATFLAGVALLLGIANLFIVHSSRLIRGNGYSAALLLAMTLVFALAVTDAAGLTDDSVTLAFNWLQAPLEAAVASLLAFFLLFAAFRLLQRQRSVWTLLFLSVVVIVMLGQTPLPGLLSDIFGSLADVIASVFVNAGMRGILIGVALGTITLSVRLLAGAEQPYNK
jgi:hypothetical protein